MLAEINTIQKFFLEKYGKTEISELTGIIEAGDYDIPYNGKTLKVTIGEDHGIKINAYV